MALDSLGNIDPYENQLKMKPVWWGAVMVDGPRGFQQTFCTENHFMHWLLESQSKSETNGTELGMPRSPGGEKLKIRNGH